MANISAFRGIRYDLGHVGSLASVVAPPYDVIDPDQQEQLYQRHPANVVRLILNRDEPGDNDAGNRYTRAARFKRNWLREGVLFVDPEPAVYVYHQSFELGGQEVTRRSFIARVQLERLDEGNIHPHEETHPKAREDRLKLWSACKANLSPIFSLYPDAQNEAQELLETESRGEAPVEVVDGEGITHRLWPVTSPQVISRLGGAMGSRSLYIADGHHRYETALAYRDQQLGDEADNQPQHPASSVMMACVSMSDPGMIVLPTHRLFRGLPAMTSAELIDRLGDSFDCEIRGHGPQLATEIWDEIEQDDLQGQLGLYCAADDTWVRTLVTPAGEARFAATTVGRRSSAWRELGVSLLHHLIVADLLSAPQLPAPKYVRTLGELSEGLRTGDIAGRDATGQEGEDGKFELAAVVMPADLKHIQKVCTAGERMPAKSTFFYPKLLSGLVINPLE